MRHTPLPSGDPAAHGSAATWSGRAATSSSRFFGASGLLPGSLPFRRCCSACAHCTAFEAGLAAHACRCRFRPRPRRWTGASVRTPRWPLGPTACALSCAALAPAGGPGASLRCAAVPLRSHRYSAAAQDALRRDGLQDEFSGAIISSQLQPAEPGQTPDPADDAPSYRTIAVTALLSKVLSRSSCSRAYRTTPRAATCSRPSRQRRAVRPRARNVTPGHGQPSSARADAQGSPRTSSTWSWPRRSAAATQARCSAGMQRHGLTPGAASRTAARCGARGRAGSMLVHGVATPPFPTLSGVPQGCPRRACCSSTSSWPGCRALWRHRQSCCTARHGASRPPASGGGGIPVPAVSDGSVGMPAV